MVKNPKFAVQASENLKPCFDYLLKKGLKLWNIGPQDINQGNTKLTLAFIFHIILDAQVDNIEVDGLKGQHGLLLWVNRHIEPYGQRVSDFKGSWRDGLAFAALAAALCPDYNFNNAEGMEQNDRHQTAYDKFEEDLKVSKLLDPEDFNEDEIDDKSVLTYVSSIFNAVASGDESRRHVQAIDKVAQLAMKHGSLIIKYEREAKAYVKVLDSKEEYFKKTEPKDGKECRRLIKELEEYKKVEKTDIKSKKTELEGMLEDIHDSQRSENRPVYIPPEGLGPNEISQKYRDVEEAENEYEERLLKKFKYFLIIEQLMNQLDRKCQRLSDRMLGNVEKISDGDLGNSYAECQQKLTELDDLEAEDEDTEKEVKELHQILEEFPKDCTEYSEAVDMVENVEHIQEEWDDKKKEYRERLLENMEKQLELERLEREMVKEADKIDEQLDHVELLLGKSKTDDPFGTAEASSNATEARDELDKVKSKVKDLRDKQERLQSEGKDEEVKRHPVQPIEKRIAELEAALGAREEELDEINRHTEECNAALREYDELANEVQRYVQDNTDDLHAKKALPSDDQLADIQAKKDDYNRPPECYQRMKEKENECRAIGTSTESFGPINSIWTQYGKHLNRKEAKLIDDANRKKSESLSPEEEELVERVYNSLNTDGAGLTVDSLREALQALGINMSLNDIMAKLKAMGYEVSPNLRLGLPDLKKFLLELKATKNNKEDIHNSWKYLAKNKDMISEADVDKYFSDCKSYPYLKESMPPNSEGMCDYKGWTESAFKH